MKRRGESTHLEGVIISDSSLGLFEFKAELPNEAEIFISNSTMKSLKWAPQKSKNE